MSDKLKHVANKLDEIESCIAVLKDNIKNMIDYFQNQCLVPQEKKDNVNGDTNDEQN